MPCFECIHSIGLGGLFQCHSHSSFSLMMKLERHLSEETQVDGLKVKLTTKLRNGCYVILVTNNIICSNFTCLFISCQLKAIFMHFLHTHMYVTFTILHRLPLLHAYKSISQNLSKTRWLFYIRQLLTKTIEHSELVSVLKYNCNAVKQKLPYFRLQIFRTRIISCYSNF